MLAFGSIFWKQKGALLENRCQNIHFWTGNICGYSGKCACLKNDLQYIPGSIDDAIDEENDLADNQKYQRMMIRIARRVRVLNSFIDKANDT